MCGQYHLPSASCAPWGCSIGTTERSGEQRRRLRRGLRRNGTVGKGMEESFSIEPTWVLFGEPAASAVLTDYSGTQYHSHKQCRGRVAIDILSVKPASLSQFLNPGNTGAQVTHQLAAHVGSGRSGTKTRFLLCTGAGQGTKDYSPYSSCSSKLNSFTGRLSLSISSHGFLPISMFAVAVSTSNGPPRRM